MFNKSYENQKKKRATIARQKRERGCDLCLHYVPSGNKNGVRKCELGMDNCPYLVDLNIKKEVNAKEQSPCFSCPFTKNNLCVGSCMKCILGLLVAPVEVLR